MFAEGIHNRSGTVLSSRYSLVKHLGAGATGHVYLATDKELGDSEVAIKILFPHLLSQSNSLDRFRSEVNIVRALSHKNIIKVFGLEKSEEGLYFLVMEYIKGIALSDFLSKSPDARLPVDVAHLILFDIADAVAHAHERGVIHRDLKPQNVIVSETGLIKVCDFGLARQLASENALTRTGDSLGTPYYMAPEIFKAESLDERTDVYALGIMSYELLCGRRPFQAEVFYALALEHVQANMPPFPSELYIPTWFQEITFRATQKAKEDRFPSARLLAKSLEEHLSEESKERHLQFNEEWKNREKVRIQLLRTRRRKKIVKVFSWFIVFLIVVISLLARLDPRQQWVFGVPVLALEQQVGPVVSPLKWLLGIYFSPTEQELRDRVLSIAPRRPDEDELEYLAEGNKRTYEVRMLLDVGVDPNLLDSTGQPLILALTHLNREDWAVHLADRLAFNPNIKDDEGTPLLNIAFEKSMSKLTFRLFGNPKLDLTLTDKNGENIFHRAVVRRDLSLVGKLAELQADPDFPSISPIDTRNKKGQTGLSMALEDKSYPNDILFLLLRYSNLKLTYERRQTPLILATLNEKANAVEIILKKVPEQILERDEDGHTALYYASRLKDPAILNLFLSEPLRQYLPSLLSEVEENRRADFVKFLEKSSGQ